MDNNIRIGDEDIHINSKFTLTIRDLMELTDDNEKIARLLEGKPHTIHYTDDNDLTAAIETLIVKNQKRNFFHYKDIGVLCKVLRKKEEIRSMYISDYTYDRITEDIMEFLNDESFDEINEFLELTDIIGNALQEDKKGEETIAV